MVITSNDGVNDPLAIFGESAAAAYDAQIINSNLQTPLLIIGAFLLLAALSSGK
jgi:hypothetical protein